MKDKKDFEKEIRAILRKGKHTVYCQLIHVSRSGMMRAISFSTIINNEPHNLPF